MILYLCRHASAEEPRPGQSDAERALTSEGIKKFRAAARGFLTLEPEIRHILTSPLLRARQTAELLADVCADDKRSVDVTVSESLAPPGRLRALLLELDALRSPAAVAVGHEPILSSWLGELCFAHPGSCELKKGAIAAIDLDPHRRARGTLLFLLQPAHLRALR